MDLTTIKIKSATLAAMKARMPDGVTYDYYIRKLLQATQLAIGIEDDNKGMK